AAACSPHFRPLYLFWQDTGASLVEGLSLHWDQLNLVRCYVEFRGAEDAEERERVIPLQPRLLEALGHLPHREGIVFLRPDAKAYSRPERPAASVKTAFVKACERAGIKNF